ncbi:MULTISPECIES: hypothetical protein [unclassified Bosea (in: a-proteobacteria)]|uniref:hypothetical protein n=1 Tax=unclassified Bosea (in: a-proteobacteria) TaxID=2653178 RepID=UPI000F76272A|nr:MULTISPECIES: hypothetical protein [unclassified Bosea (in: a-proteobacteria)]AZO78090.1 hypothetical protein BLM15_11085 [Bosea sp. Tri-49]RXT20431.1 hypothetical protein B5U98_20930 [Bosea sp. Tri-39]RXT37303.1 hypothetical protein B5U99_15245 [Bosea sp. Tri-54]
MFVLDPTTLVGFHTWLSIIAIVAGIPMTAALLKGHLSQRWNGVYLSTSAATDITGYVFPFSGVLPSHIVGAISLVLLAIAAVALYGRGLQGGWRRTYAITAVLSFYLLIFVLIAQLFLKVTVLHNMAPTQSEPPFAIAQGIVLAIFLALTVLATRRFGNGVAPLRSV